MAGLDGCIFHGVFLNEVAKKGNEERVDRISLDRMAYSMTILRAECNSQNPRSAFLRDLNRTRKKTARKFRCQGETGISLVFGNRGFAHEKTP